MILDQILCPFLFFHESHLSEDGTCIWSHLLLLFLNILRIIDPNGFTPLDSSLKSRFGFTLCKDLQMLLRIIPLVGKIHDGNRDRWDNWMRLWPLTVHSKGIV
jgi:hypothetical protein